MANHTQNGKAYEYAIAQALNMHTHIGISINDRMKKAENLYNSTDIGIRNNMDVSAEKTAAFICSQESDRIDFDCVSIDIQGDYAGRAGDVRDVVIVRKDGNNIGISAKHNHDAIKHSRLSNNIDFGQQWGNHPVSNNYKNSIKPTFDTLSKLAKAGKHFRDFPDKIDLFYTPILTAFEKELKRLCNKHSSKFIKPLFKYLIGQQDFYKAICHNDYTDIISFNIDGSLKWGKKWRIPERIVSIQKKPSSKSTLLVTLESGWLISFRLHSAKSVIEPSLKFDISFIGMNAGVAKHTIDHKIL